MKIRLQNSSFCIRLSGSDFAQLSEHTLFNEDFPLGENALFSLTLSIGEGTKFYFEKAQDRLLLEIPKSDFETWKSNPAILGLKAAIMSSQGNDFELIIEKDVREAKKEKTPTPDHAYIILS